MTSVPRQVPWSSYMGFIWINGENISWYVLWSSIFFESHQRIDDHSLLGENNSCSDGIQRARSRSTNAPSLLRGVGGARRRVNREWKARSQLQCTGGMPGKCHTKNSSWQTTSRGHPLPSEKPMAYRNSNVVRAAASKMTNLRRLYSNKLKHKGKQESFGKQVQASIINCKQIKTRKNLSQSAGT